MGMYLEHVGHVDATEKLVNGLADVLLPSYRIRLVGEARTVLLRITALREALLLAQRPQEKGGVVDH